MTVLDGPLRVETALALAARFADEEGLAADLSGRIAEEMLEALGSERTLAVSAGGDTAVLVVDGRASRAWCLGVTCPERAVRETLVRAACEAARRAGASRLYSGGPARWYLWSGVATESAQQAWRDAGGLAVSDHRDARVVLPQGDRGLDSPPERASGRGSADIEAARTIEELDAACAWITSEFSEDWAAEARRAFGQGAVFVARSGSSGDIVGFAAHSGHAAARGTFGPLGVGREARGQGLGARLADRALRDLQTRGFRRILIPWVDPAVLPMYQRVAPVLTVERRVLYRCGLG
jgi:predicted N-acetyltransferase YhbS